MNHEKKSKDEDESHQEMNTAKISSMNTEVEETGEDPKRTPPTNPMKIPSLFQTEFSKHLPPHKPNQHRTTNNGKYLEVINHMVARY